LNRSQNARAVWAFACALFALALFILGSTSYAVGVVVSPWDKAVHGAAFAVLTLLLFRTLGASRWAIAAALAVCIGIADELHQAFLPGRNADAMDLMADAAGAALMALALRRSEKARA
jgi:VanZ family protein